MTNSITLRFVAYLNEKYEGEALTIEFKPQFEELRPIYLMNISKGDKHAKLLWDLERLQDMDIEGIQKKNFLVFFMLL